MARRPPALSLTALLFAHSYGQQLDNYPHRLVMLLPPSPMNYSALPTIAPRPYTYKLIGMLGIIIVSMSLIATGYIAVGTAGYAAFPQDVSSNILNTFPPDDVVMQVGCTAGASEAVAIWLGLEIGARGRLCASVLPRRGGDSALQLHFAST